MGNYAYGHASEFAYGWHGTCGQVSLAQAVQAARRGDVATAAIQALMNDITHDMQSRGWAAANGAATLWGLARAAEVQGAAIEYEHDYQEPLPIDVRTVLQHNRANTRIVPQYGTHVDRKRLLIVVLVFDRRALHLGSTGQSP